MHRSAGGYFTVGLSVRDQLCDRPSYSLDGEGVSSAESGDMRNQSTAPRPTVLAVGVLFSGFVALTSGPLAMVGWLLAGALIGSWAYVYVRVMCAGNAVDWVQFFSAAVWGALALPVLAVTGRVVDTLWLLAGLGIVVWAVLVSPQGRMPDRVKNRCRAVQTVARQLLRGP